MSITLAGQIKVTRPRESGIPLSRCTAAKPRSTGAQLHLPLSNGRMAGSKRVNRFVPLLSLLHWLIRWSTTDCLSGCKWPTVASMRRMPQNSASAGINAAS